MYTFKKSYGLSIIIGSHWEEINLSTVSMTNVFSDYYKVFLVLTNPVISGDIYVNVDSLRLLYAGYRGTLNELLVTIGNNTIETVDSLPVMELKYATYSDAVRSEYKINLTKIGALNIDGIPTTGLSDLVLTRPKYKTSLADLHKYCLLSVNGYYHMTSTLDGKTYIHNGGDTMYRSKFNHVGILSFLNIGSLKKIPISLNNIFKEAPDSTLKNKIIFIVDEDLENKSCFLILGGYIVFPENNVFWKSGEKTFTLDIKQLPYLERLFESNNFLNLRELGLSNLELNTESINLQQAWSDEVIKKYLTMSQSFLVSVNIPYLTNRKLFIRHSNVPGMFISYSDPIYPLYVSYGRMAEYWKVHENGQWCVTVQDNFLKRYIISQQPTDRYINVNGNLVPDRPQTSSRGHLLEICGFNIY